MVTGLSRPEMCRQCEQYYSVNLGEVSGTKRKYLKGKINSTDTKSTNKNIGDLRKDISEFQKGHKLRAHLVTDGKVNLLAETRSNLHG
jgi:hypothetical protein